MSEKYTKRYLIKYGLCLAAAHFGVTMFGVSMLLMFHIGKLDKSNKALKSTVENMKKVDHTFRSILRMEQMKENYRQQGIEAKEEDNP